jgi:hypothetical protein
VNGSPAGDVFTVRRGWNFVTRRRQAIVRRMVYRPGTTIAAEQGMERATIIPPSDTSIFFRALAGFAIAVLVGVGVGGTAYKLATPGGWLSQLFGHSLPESLGALLAFLVIGLCFWLMRGWISRSGGHRYSELPVYVCAGAGVLYALQVAMTL